MTVPRYPSCHQSGPAAITIPDPHPTSRPACDPLTGPLTGPAGEAAPGRPCPGEIVDAVVRYRAARARYRGALRRHQQWRDKLPLLDAKTAAEARLLAVVARCDRPDTAAAYHLGCELVAALQAEAQRMVAGIGLPPEHLHVFARHARQQLDHPVHARVRQLLRALCRAITRPEGEVAA